MKNDTGLTGQRNYNSIESVSYCEFLFAGHPWDAWEENDGPNQWGTCTRLYSKSKNDFLHFNRLSQDEV